MSNDDGIVWSKPEEGSREFARDIIHVSPGIPNLDELAARLNVQPVESAQGALTLLGVSGKWYDLVEILSAHVRYMDEGKPI